MGKGPFSFKRSSSSKRRPKKFIGPPPSPFPSPPQPMRSPPTNNNNANYNTSLGVVAGGGAAAVKGKKKAGGARLWMRFDSFGGSELVECDKNAIIRRAAIPARDLRILGPVFSHSSSILENANVVTKGREVKYGNILLGMVISLDLSDNIISGEIPEELTSLIYLQSVNLSYNLLSGRIPPKIGDMRWLESLDLSMNQLCGQIAPSMSRLTFLSALNLSHNNLTGEIPKSTQLQSFDQSSFIGNKLCGPPLEVNCSNTNGTVPPVADQKHGGSYLLEDGWFYLSLGLGFLFGFWSVLGSLLLNLPWSIVFSRFQNSIVKKLYGVIVEHF